MTAPAPTCQHVVQVIPGVTALQCGEAATRRVTATCANGHGAHGRVFCEDHTIVLGLALKRGMTCWECVALRLPPRPVALHAVERLTTVNAGV